MLFCICKQNRVKGISVINITGTREADHFGKGNSDYLEDVLVSY